jgi:hypothetical protein
MKVNTSPVPQGFIPLAAYATQVGVTPQTVRRWIATDCLPSVRLGRRTFIPENALQLMLERKAERGR